MLLAFALEGLVDEAADGLCARRNVRLFAAPIVHSLQEILRKTHLCALGIHYRAWRSNFFCHWGLTAMCVHGMFISLDGK